MSKLPVAVILGIWSKFVTFTMPINSSLELARFKPSQPFTMSSGTNKCPKIMKFGSIFASNYINAAHDSAEQKVNSNEPSKVT